MGSESRVLEPCLRGSVHPKIVEVEASHFIEVGYDCGNDLRVPVAARAGNGARARKPSLAMVASVQEIVGSSKVDYVP